MFRKQVAFLAAAFLFLASLLLLSVTPTAANATDVHAKIDRRVLEDTANGQSAHFLILLDEQADLSHAKMLGTRQEKGTHVVQALREVAARTQPRVVSQLDRLGVHYRRYWIVNMIVVEGDRHVAEALAQNPAVAKIEASRPVRLDEPLEPRLESTAGTTAAGPEWGVAKIGAPEVWDMGYRGQGVVIANQDTGVQWDHPALRNQYRGWNGTSVDHNYNWWDAIHDDFGSGGNPCGFSSPVPCDDSGHGTHTVGTAVGDDGGTNQIGVAPNAEWIGCRNMDQGVGRPDTYIECFQFFLAPTDLNGENPNPALAPDIISNSWTCPASEGCEADTLRMMVETMRSAGIMVVVSAGNSGSACATLYSPPGLYDAATSVGATDINDNIAPFSSRGPVTVDGSNRIKPDITAPGVRVRSAWLNGEYGVASGTSMAAPHVAGSVALLWSARPDLLADIDRTENLLFSSALPLTSVESCGSTPGTTIPNNTYGWGRLDIKAAVSAPPEATNRLFLPLMVKRSGS